VSEMIKLQRLHVLLNSLSLLANKLLFRQALRGDV
jgi:hypothetical protein